MTQTISNRYERMRRESNAEIARVEKLSTKNPANKEYSRLRNLVLNAEGTYHSKSMLAFYHENPHAPGCPESIKAKHLQTVPDLPGGVSVPSLLEPQETTSPNQLKGTYRGQFMQGNESEYEATVEAYEYINDDKSSNRISLLGNCRKYAHFAVDKTSGDVRVMTDSCRQRWCPMCAGQKAKFAKESTQRWVQGLEKPRFLTLTLRNEPGDLLPQVQFLQDSFRRLRQKTFWKKKVTGGIWFMQVKRGKDSGCWHPHLHILLDGLYLEQGELSDLWDQVTYGSPIIDIRQIRNPEESAKYVARYSARPARLGEQSIPDRVEIIQAMHGKRLSGTFGTAKSVTLTPPKVEKNDDFVHVGYYDQLVRDSVTNRAAAAVLTAWKTDQPLPGWAFDILTAKQNILTAEGPRRKKVIQTSFDFYNSS